jgi:putative glutamine amidotransferase
MRPRIGIARGREGRAGACAEAVAESGGEPIWLGSAGRGAQPPAAADALLVPGGPDFLPPSPYPGGVRFAPVSPERLAFDLALLADARAAELPILGICYGMQLLAFASGGSLHYHVPLDVPGALEHRHSDPAARHAVQLAPGSRLAALFGLRELAVNSRHHQAVSEPGPGLRAVARSADALIEAVEAEGGADAPFVVGVQWHPEDLEPLHRSTLFGALVEAAAARRAGALSPAGRRRDGAGPAR